MKRIAVIGTGIAGLTAAHHLAPHHRLTVYEANDYIGGHTHTVPADWQGERTAIDTGFIVFNDRTYPNFIKLMEQIGVRSQPTEMSFSVRNDATGLEYCGSSLSGLFAQRRNLYNPSFLRLLYDILRFNRQVHLARGETATLGDFLERHPYSRDFADNYLLPMVAAIWSMGLDDARSFPLAFFIRFFENHGLLELTNRPQWYTIVGGSSSYIEPLTTRFKNAIRLSTPVRRIRRGQEGIEVQTSSSSERFDEAILACHADEALALLEEPSLMERQVLGGFSFNPNRVTLHTDLDLLPRSRRAWASWNYRTAPESEKPTLTYNMNILQRLDSPHTYLVTLNQPVAPEKVLAEFTYHHPVYTTGALAAQERWAEISGRDRLHFCGAYWFNGFHEDGVRSALRVCSDLGVEP